MKKSKIFLFSMLIMFLIMPLTQVSAWKNGSYAYDNTKYDYSTDYGTHDWIADLALDALLDDDKSQWSWLNERREIYLLGTEAPDNSNVDVTLDGKDVEGFGDTTKHHVYLEWADGSVVEDDSALRTKKCADLADSYLEEKKYELAAFYLGAMTHYIADLSMYAHVAENNIAPHNLDFDEYHTEVEGYVKTRSNEHEDMEEFFKISDVDIDDEEKPYNLAIDLAWDTYKDPDGSNDAPWLHNNFFTSWASDYDDRASESSTRQEYYDRIEESLNNAIEACACALAYVGGAASIPGYSIFLTLFIMGISIIGITIFVLKKKMN